VAGSPQAQDPLARLVEAALAAPPLAGGRRVVGLDGRSGTGKTTLAGRLAVALGRVPVVHLDDLYPGWDGLEAGVDRLLDGVLRPLATGAATVTEFRWDWTADHDGEPLILPAADLTVVEGAGCGALRCTPYLSLLVWLEAPEAQRRAQALARDGALFAPHWDRWAAQERAHFDRERTQARAGLVLAFSAGGAGVRETCEPGEKPR
jgi:hypothetical protein